MVTHEIKKTRWYMVPSVQAQFCPDPGFSIVYFSPLGPKKPAPEPSPNPPKLPGTAGVLPGPSGKLVHSHTRHQKNTMVYGAQCSSTVLPGSRFFYRLFFASGPPKTGPGAVPRSRPGAQNRYFFKGF